MHEPIAYIYNADYHCPACTEAKFGADADGYIAIDAKGDPCLDSEGNEIGIIASWDTDWAENAWYEGESVAILTCGTCHQEIRRLERRA